MPRAPLSEPLILRLSWREWRHHPWRHGIALLAVALGVALAWSVHLINASALAEFAAAVRSANGQPDLSLRGQREGFDDALFERVAPTPASWPGQPGARDRHLRRAASGPRVRCACSASMRCASPRWRPNCCRARRGDDRSPCSTPERGVRQRRRARERLGVNDGDGRWRCSAGPALEDAARGRRACRPAARRWW